MRAPDNNKRNPVVRKLSFALGAVCVTGGAEQALAPEDIIAAITRHARGDWGDIDDDDWNENETSLQNGHRLLSNYFAKNGTRFWVITESDRSVTTVLLPEEY